MSTEAELEGLRAAAEAMLEAETAYKVAGFTRSKTLQDEALSNLTKAHMEHVPKFSTPVLIDLLDSLQSTRAALEKAEAVLEVAHDTLRQTEKQRDTYRDLLGFFVTDEKHGHIARKALGLEPDDAAPESAASREDA